jgi:ribosomal 50S subunit-recycling heat shock protein
MRLDKFLQVSRLIKRRMVATEFCRSGRVSVNEAPAKPGRELRVGDHIALNFGAHGRLVCEVLLLPERGVRKDEAANLYRTLTDTRVPQPQD